jgi:hypothetical protein
VKGLVLAALGLCVLRAAPWILSRIARRFGTDDVPLPTLRYRYPTADESLPVRTARKRSEAEALRRRAALVDSGRTVSDVARIVR